MAGEMTRDEFLQMSPEDQESFTRQFVLKKFNELPKEQRSQVSKDIQEQGFLDDLKDGALDAFMWVGRQIDRVGGAPTRAAIGELMETGDIGEAAVAF